MTFPIPNAPRGLDVYELASPHEYYQAIWELRRRIDGVSFRFWITADEEMTDALVAERLRAAVAAMARIPKGGVDEAAIHP